MKQLFQTYLTWGSDPVAVGHNLSAYTDEEHLSGNRKRLNQLRKKTDEMNALKQSQSGEYAAVQPAQLGQSLAPGQPSVQIDCNPPSTAVAATSASASSAKATPGVSYAVPSIAWSTVSGEYATIPVSYATPSAQLEADVQKILNDLSAVESGENQEQTAQDVIAEAAAKVASKIKSAITTEMQLTALVRIKEPITREIVLQEPPPGTIHAASDAPKAEDRQTITGELPALNFEPAKSENKSGLSGSFLRQSSSENSMSRWKGKKEAGKNAWDSRVESGVKAYEKNSKQSYVGHGLQSPVDALPHGFSFVEMDAPEDVAIESFGSGEVKMVTSFDKHGESVRSLSSMRNAFKMLECREETPTQVEQSASAEEAKEPIAALVQDAMELFATPEAEHHDSLEDLISDCLDAAQIFEDLNDQLIAATSLIGEVDGEAVAAIESVIEDTAEISFAPEACEESICEGFAGDFSVTMTESLSADIFETGVFNSDELNFDPISFVPQTIDGEPIEAVCVFDSEKLSFKAADAIRTNLEAMFNLDPLSFESETEESNVEIDNVTVISIEDCEALEVAAIGGKPSRQRAKGTSRSKKTQTRREKRSKKRAATIAAANA